MIVYEITKNHDGWYETELVKSQAKAEFECEYWEETTDYTASYREIELVDWLMETLDGQVNQLDGEWLIDNLRNVLGD